MTTDCAALARSASFEVTALGSFPRKGRSLGSALRWVLCAGFCGGSLLSSQATVAPAGSQPIAHGLADISSSVSTIHGFDGVYPVLGLLAAVASTYVLRHRRQVQLQAIATSER